MTSAARRLSCPMASTISRTWTMLGGLCDRKRRAAPTLARIAASGWFSSCAIATDNSPTIDNRSMWASSRPCSFSCSSVCLREVMSTLIPTIRVARPSASKSVLPLDKIHLTVPSGRTMRNSTSIGRPARPSCVAASYRGAIVRVDECREGLDADWHIERHSVHPSRDVGPLEPLLSNVPFPPPELRRVECDGELLLAAPRLGFGAGSILHEAWRAT